MDSTYYTHDTTVNIAILAALRKRFPHKSDWQLWNFYLLNRPVLSDNGEREAWLAGILK